MEPLCLAWLVYYRLENIWSSQGQSSLKTRDLALQPFWVTLESIGTNPNLFQIILFSSSCFYKGNSFPKISYDINSNFKLLIFYNNLHQLS